MHRSLKIFGIITTIGMLIVLIQGALVTQTGSGDACGSQWLLCNDQVIPGSPSIETLIEFSHRAVSALLGIMVITLSIWSWKAIGHLKETKCFAILAILFIIIQGLLGGAAVVWNQSAAVMALHFGFSLISFSSVLLLTILAFEDGQSKKYTIPTLSIAMKRYVYFLLIYTYLVVYSGAFVKHTDSSSACSGWPFCNGQLIPLLEGGTAIQFWHRVVAGILFLLIFTLFIQLLRKYQSEKAVFYSGILAFIFISIQVISGAIVVFSGFLLYATLFHALMVSLLFATLSYMSLLAFRAK